MICVLALLDTGKKNGHACSGFFDWKQSPG